MSNIINEHLAYFLLDLLLIFLIHGLISKFKLMHTKWFTNLLHVMEPFHIKLLAFFAVLLWFPVFNQHFWGVFYPKRCLKLNEIKTITPIIFSLWSVYRCFLLQCPKVTQTMSVTSALQFSMWKNEVRKRKKIKLNQRLCWNTVLWRSAANVQRVLARCLWGLNHWLDTWIQIF